MHPEKVAGAGNLHGGDDRTGAKRDGRARRGRSILPATPLPRNQHRLPPHVILVAHEPYTVERVTAAAAELGLRVQCAGAGSHGGKLLYVARCLLQVTAITNSQGETSLHYRGDEVLAKRLGKKCSWAATVAR